MLTPVTHAPALLLDITDYWAHRASDYSDANQSELDSIKRDVWTTLIASHVPQGRTLRVLDVGCGPGFFSIIMAQAGHHVTAVDTTQAMLDEARNNAEGLNLQIDLIESDAQDLPFQDNEFDVVLSRNLTWNLYQPDAAYKEWYRVLKPNGQLLNFDANWYLHLFDDEYSAGFEQDRQTTKRLNVPDHYVNTDTKAMTAIALQLPLSKILRPQWDVSALIETGFHRLFVDTKVGDYVWDGEEKINYSSTPMFMIAAQK